METELVSQLKRWIRSAFNRKQSPTLFHSENTRKRTLMAVFNEMQKLILFSHSSNVFIVDLAFRSDVFVDKLFNCNCKIIHFMSFPAHLLKPHHRFWKKHQFSRWHQIFLSNFIDLLYIIQFKCKQITKISQNLALLCFLFWFLVIFSPLIFSSWQSITNRLDVHRKQQWSEDDTKQLLPEPNVIPMPEGHKI